MAERRELLRAGLATATLTWVAPSIVALDRVAAASPSVPCEVPVVGGGAQWIPPPTSIAEGGPLDSNTWTYVWAEQGPVQLTSPLLVNRTAPGGPFGGTGGSSSNIAAGTWVCSYYVHGDRLDDNGRLTGSMTFANSNIIGLIYKRNDMTASLFLGAPGTTYANGPMEGSDQMWLTANSLRWDMRFGGALDGIRVITDCP